MDISKIEKYHKWGLWTDKMVALAVSKGKMPKEKFLEVTKIDYDAYKEKEAKEIKELEVK